MTTNPTATKPSLSRIDELDGLRGILTLWVALGQFGNKFNGDPVVMTNTLFSASNPCPMHFINNVYVGNWAAAPFYFQQNPAASNTYVAYWGNYSASVRGDTDGQPLGQNFNAANLTNLNATQLTGTLPAAILPGITTNVSSAGISFYI